MNPVQFFRMFGGQPVTPLQNLSNACAIYVQHGQSPGLPPCEAGMEVVSELLPEDAQRYDEIVTISADIMRLADVLVHKVRRLDANQTLFWEDVHDRYEGVKLRNPDMVGVRRGDDGKHVLVCRVEDETDGTERQGEAGEA